jgi:hypothetical protein
MRYIAAILGLALLSAGVARADEQTEVGGVIDKAIKAVGGEEKLLKYKACTYKTKEYWFNLLGHQDSTAEYAIQFPDKRRRVVTERDRQDTWKDVTSISVLNGKKGWLKSHDGTVKEFDAEDSAEQLYEEWLTTLIPLKDKDFKLTSLGKAKDERAIGVRVSRKGHRDIDLYFHTEDGLLVRSVRKQKGPPPEGWPEEVLTVETKYLGYREVRGVKRPCKIRHEYCLGLGFTEIDLTEMELKEKLDDSLFKKP